MNKTLAFIVGGVVLVIITLGYFGYSAYYPKYSCKSKGGMFIEAKYSPSNKQYCILPTSDAEKKCTDSSQCEGFCMAPGGTKVGEPAVGKCSDMTDANCTVEVKEGVVYKRGCSIPIYD